MSGQPTRATAGRVVALDGLRGLAALVVVVHHVLILSSVTLADAYLHIHSRDTSSAAWWLTYSPLHLAWAGGEAVYVFFVLSGFVLAWPLARGRDMDWLAYYPKRMLRLYIPVWGSLAVAAALALVVHRRHVTGASWVLNAEAPVVWHLPPRDAALLVSDVSTLNGPLWSLRWEVVFSLLLPAFIVFGALFRRLGPVKLLLLLLMVFAASKGSKYAVDGNPYVFYMPMFGIGVLLAFHSEWVRQVVRAADRGRIRWFWPATGAAAVICLLARWLPVHAETARGSTLLLGRPLANVCAVIGAAWIVVMFWHCAPVARVGASPAVQWLGVRSFSLYLTHVPVITSLVLLFPHLSTGLLLVVAIPLCLAVASGFYRLVEGPGHRFSQRVGAWVTRVHARRAATA
jgi:peptidoglycan/LPS O-acetylase OafA/YrhL